MPPPRSCGHLMIYKKNSVRIHVVGCEPANKHAIPSDVAKDILYKIFAQEMDQALKNYLKKIKTHHGLGFCFVSSPTHNSPEPLKALAAGLLAGLFLEEGDFGSQVLSSPLYF